MPVASIDISWYFGVEWQCYNVLHPQFKHLICNFWLKTAVRFAADVLLFEGSGHLNSTFVRLYFKVFSWASVCTEKKSPLAINTSLLIALQFCGFICFSRSSQFYFIFLWLTINVFFFSCSYHSPCLPVASWRSMCYRHQSFQSKMHKKGAKIRAGQSFRSIMHNAGLFLLRTTSSFED